jgi:hypothetical protein
VEGGTWKRVPHVGRPTCSVFSDFVSRRCTFQAPKFWGRKGLHFLFSPLFLRGNDSFDLLTMNAYKPWKHTTVSLSQQEPDRPRQKPSSHNKNTEVRASARERDDARLRSGRGYVSDAPLQSSQTPAPAYPTSAQSLATASKAPHNVSIQASQGQTSYMPQKPPLPNSSLPQEIHPPAERYFEPTYDSRAMSHRAVATTPSFVSPDPVRHVEDHSRNGRHRPRQPPTPAPESTEPPTVSPWPLPSSFIKKVSPDGREREKEQSRNKAREEPKATSKTKERSRVERAQEHVLRDQREREREAKYEEEKRRERRREKERRREEEQRHDERRYDQKVGDDYPHRTTRDQERRHETRDSPVTSILPGKDARLMRVKDSDDSDNSLMKPPRSIRPPKRHQRDHTSTTVGINSVSKSSLDMRLPRLRKCPLSCASRHPHRLQWLNQRIILRQIRMSPDGRQH